MKLIYTNENRLLVSNVKNIIENAGICIVLKNEYAAGGVGDLSPFDAWLELWVTHDEDYKKAMDAINETFSTDSQKDWVCDECGEKNSPSFQLCWQCQNEKPHS